MKNKTFSDIVLCFLSNKYACLFEENQATEEEDERKKSIEGKLKIKFGITELRSIYSPEQRGYRERFNQKHDISGTKIECVGMASAYDQVEIEFEDEAKINIRHAQTGVNTGFRKSKIISYGISYRRNSNLIYVDVHDRGLDVPLEKIKTSFRETYHKRDSSLDELVTKMNSVHNFIHIARSEGLVDYASCAPLVEIGLYVVSRLEGTRNEIRLM